jgi:hypothetical protein
MARLRTSRVLAVGCLGGGADAGETVIDVRGSDRQASTHRDGRLTHVMESEFPNTCPSAT